MFHGIFIDFISFYHSFLFSFIHICFLLKTNQESSEYERIYSITSTESTARNIVQLVSPEKQNNETTISHDNNKLENSYTEISSKYIYIIDSE